MAWSPPVKVDGDRSGSPPGIVYVLLSRENLKRAGKGNAWQQTVQVRTWCCYTNVQLHTLKCYIVLAFLQSLHILLLVSFYGVPITVVLLDMLKRYVQS